MRTLIKSCLTVASVALLTVSIHAGAAPSKVKEKNEPLDRCKAECLAIKDAAAYETCMLTCLKNHPMPTTIVPTPKK